MGSVEGQYQECSQEDAVKSGLKTCLEGAKWRKELSPFAANTRSSLETVDRYSVEVTAEIFSQESDCYSPVSSLERMIFRLSFLSRRRVGRKMRPTKALVYCFKSMRDDQYLRLRWWGRKARHRIERQNPGTQWLRRWRTVTLECWSLCKVETNMLSRARSPRTEWPE